MRPAQAPLGWLLALLVTGGCAPGESETTEPVAPEAGCAPGELGSEDGGSCRPAGLRPEDCAEGFESDGRQGCVPVLPATPCAGGTMAIPGEPTCRELAPCGVAPWGDIPTDESTQHVDASYGGDDGDGSAARPWRTIAEGVAAAEPGAIVAVGSGSYAEDVRIEDQPVVLWGRCPAEVEVAGSGGVAAILVGRDASGTEVRDLAVTGSRYGLAVSGSSDVIVDRVWIHDTGGRGLLVEDSYGAASASLARSLVEASSDVGIMAYGTTLSVSESVVRDLRPGSGNGRGIVARHGATLSVRRSVVERACDHGLVLSGASAELDALVVRDTQPGAGGLFGGGVLVRRDDESDLPADVTLTASVIAANRYYGLNVEGARALVERSVIRDGLAELASGEGGLGAQAQFDTEPAQLDLVGSLVDRNVYAGIAFVGSQGRVESTIVRDTQPTEATGDFGRGVLVFRDPAGSAMGRAEVVGSVLEGNTEAALFAAAGELVVRSCALRNTAPRPRDGVAGRGMSIQGDDLSHVPATATVSDSLVEGSYEVGIYVEGSTVHVERSVVRDTAPQLASGTLGDSVSAVSMFALSPTIERAAIILAGSTIRRGARAGVASFGSDVSLQGVTFDCNAIDLNGQDSIAGAYSFGDEGSNRCGCGRAERACAVSTDALEPPEVVGP